MPKPNSPALRMPNVEAVRLEMLMEWMREKKLVSGRVGSKADEACRERSFMSSGIEWGEAEEKAFIQALVQHKPVGALTLVDLAGGYVCIDGRSRLKCITRFLNGEIPYADP
ncbi:hypothetical protein FA13DRAFT_1795012 [Coprinellus micaceus]|uniref:ParB/Sulfiredoxin domain-containing protein n=1 Tax=Coprinellus micaceus TaxID=71717 RepID=A0A4Y7SZQ1_COPMI|nr:hypothetical protein FA13DRAFT_1795012 [Coprinellus micaceus]